METDLLIEVICCWISFICITILLLIYYRYPNKRTYSFTLIIMLSLGQQMLIIPNLIMLMIYLVNPSFKINEFLNACQFQAFLTYSGEITIFM